MESIVVAVRIHRINQQDKTKPIDLKRLKMLVAAHEPRIVMIAFPEDDEVLKREIALQLHKEPTVVIVGVCKWGSFVPALNRLLYEARARNAQHILFQSVEVECPSQAIQDMHSTLTSTNALVVGLRLHGHAFQEGIRRLDGLTTPWNTMALWSVAKLCLIGFVMVAEGLEGEWLGGVEEVATIAVLQKIIGKDNAKAFVLQSGQETRQAEIKWNSEWEDEGRRKWHETKMASKLKRAAIHLQKLDLAEEEFQVMHVVIRAS